MKLFVLKERQTIIKSLLSKDNIISYSETRYQSPSIRGGLSSKPTSTILSSNSIAALPEASKTRQTYLLANKPNTQSSIR